MARLLGHRQSKEAATDKPNLPLPRHIPTLPNLSRYVMKRACFLPISESMLIHSEFFPQLAELPTETVHNLSIIRLG